MSGLESANMLGSPRGRAVEPSEQTHETSNQGRPVQQNLDAMLVANSDSGGAYAKTMAVLDVGYSLDGSMAHEP